MCWAITGETGELSTGKSIFRKQNWGLESWLCGYEHWLLLQRVQFGPYHPHSGSRPTVTQFYGIGYLF